MKRKTKRQNFTKRLKEEAKWDAARNVIDSTLGSGTNSIKWKLMKRLTLLPFQGKEVAADIPDLRNVIDERLRLVGWKEVFETLTERERLVIDCHYFKSLTLIEISRKFHVTYERVRQIHMKALRKLRHPKRMDLMRKFDIPIHEEWYLKKEITTTVKDNTTLPEENEWIPPKPIWVKVDFTEDGVPYLVADVQYIWYVKPVTRKVYDAWIIQALEENEALHTESSDWKSAPSI